MKIINTLGDMLAIFMMGAAGYLALCHYCPPTSIHIHMHQTAHEGWGGLS